MMPSAASREATARRAQSTGPTMPGQARLRGPRGPTRSRATGTSQRLGNGDKSPRRIAWTAKLASESSLDAASLQSGPGPSSFQGQSKRDFFGGVKTLLSSCGCHPKSQRARNLLCSHPMKSSQPEGWSLENPLWLSFSGEALVGPLAQTITRQRLAPRWEKRSEGRRWTLFLHSSFYQDGLVSVYRENLLCARFAPPPQNRHSMGVHLVGRVSNTPRRQGYSPGRPRAAPSPARMCNRHHGQSPTEARRARWQASPSSTRSRSVCSRRRSSPSASPSRHPPRTPCRKSATSKHRAAARSRTRCRPRTDCAPSTGRPSRSVSRPGCRSKASSSAGCHPCSPRSSHRLA